jgi:hypothetical protein
MGYTLRVVVTARNAAGTSAPVTSNASPVVVATFPAMVTRPTVTGNTLVGRILTADKGTWVGPGPITYSYQWRRCATGVSGCDAIAGATHTTYIVRSADVGHTSMS